MDSSFMEDRQLMRTQLNLLLQTTRLWDSQDYVQHGDTSCYLHSIAVAWYSLRLARRLQIPVHAEELVRGALLHDYFLYDWHRKDSPRLHGLRHPFIALKKRQPLLPADLAGKADHPAAHVPSGPAAALVPGGRAGLPGGQGMRGI